MRHIPQIGVVRRSALHQRNVGHVVQGLHFRLRNFHLDLVTDSGFRILPEIPGNEPAGPGRSFERLRNLLNSETELACPNAVNVHIKTGVVKRLSIMKVAQVFVFRQLRANLFRIGMIGGHMGPWMATSMGVGEPKSIIWLTMSPDSKVNAVPGKSRASTGRNCSSNAVT